MTPQQQQALIHSILIKQLKEKQQIAMAASAGGTPTPSLPQPQPSSSTASKDNVIHVFGMCFAGQHHTKCGWF